MQQGAFWEANHVRIEQAVLHEQEANPAHTNWVIPEWGMKTIAEACAAILYEDGVFCDRVRLMRLLDYLTGGDVEMRLRIPYDTYGEAAALRDQVKQGKRE